MSGVVDECIIAWALIENFGTSCESEPFSGNPDNRLTEMKVPYGRLYIS
jgi:hypothetical protein